MGERGIAPELRHLLTEFGSAWIRKLLAMGVSSEKIALAAYRQAAVRTGPLGEGTFKLGITGDEMKALAQNLDLGTNEARVSGLAEQIESIRAGGGKDIGRAISRAISSRFAVRVGGETVLRGQRIARGTFKYSQQGYGLGKLSRKNVVISELHHFETTPLATEYGQTTEFMVGNFERKLAREEFDLWLDPVHSARKKFLDPYTREAGAGALSPTQVAKEAKLRIKAEVQAQRIARAQYGDLVPEVYGEIESGLGFVQEYAGRSLSSIAEKLDRLTSMRKGAALQFAPLRGTESGLLRAARLTRERVANAIKRTSATGEYMRHFDLHSGNVLYRGGKTTIIDWGIAAPMEFTPAQQRYYHSLGEQVIHKKTAAFRDLDQAHQQARAAAARVSSQPIVPQASLSIVAGSKTGKVQRSPSEQLNWELGIREQQKRIDAQVRAAKRSALQSNVAGIGLELNANRRTSHGVVMGLDGTRRR